MTSYLKIDSMQHSDQIFASETGSFIDFPKTFYIPLAACTQIYILIVYILLSNKIIYKWPHLYIET